MNHTPSKMSNRKAFLLLAYKACLGLSGLAIAYILLAGLFTSPEPETKQQHTLQLPDLNDLQHAYLKVDNRELLVIKTNNQMKAFWAQDPIYGCRLNVSGKTIKPVCIDITYNFDGISKDKKDRLKSPEYKIYNNNIVIYK